MTKRLKRETDDTHLIVLIHSSMVIGKRANKQKIKYRIANWKNERMNI